MSDKALPKKTIEILGKKMAYYDEGQGIPIFFLHGNPTSSYLWRDVISELQGCGRLIAPDMIGMGDSEKLPGAGPKTYTFENHRSYLWSLINELVEPSQKVVLVIHDWGSALGFNWAYGHPNRVAGIAYLEAIVSQYTKWDEWSPTSIPLFKGFRSDKGEEMILDQNMFVERILFGSIFRELSEKEKAEYRRPFLKREDRWPTLSWPRQLPIEGEPPHIVDMVNVYSKWMSENEIPKLFINGDPGAILHSARREFCRRWKNQLEVTVKGRHFLQEDSGAEIGRSIRSWLGKYKLS
jgi:haloalkane dehalogenase